MTFGFSNVEATGDLDRFTDLVNDSKDAQRGDDNQTGLRNQRKLLEGGRLHLNSRVGWDGGFLLRDLSATCLCT